MTGSPASGKVRENFILLESQEMEYFFPNIPLLTVTKPFGIVSPFKVLFLNRKSLFFFYFYLGKNILVIFHFIFKALTPRGKIGFFDTEMIFPGYGSFYFI